MKSSTKWLVVLFTVLATLTLITGYSSATAKPVKQTQTIGY